MRRAGAGFVVMLLLIPALAALAVTSSANVKDTFPKVGYSGSEGSLPWAGSWVEFGDDGKAGTGRVHVGPEYCSGGNCLHVESQDMIFDESAGVKRFADLSSLATAELRFSLVTHTVGEGQLAVYVTRDGVSWSTMETFNLEGEKSWHPAIAIDEFLDDGFGLKLLVSGSNGIEIAVDDVEIKGTVVAEETTTTSTTSTTEPTTSSTDKRITTTTADVPDEPADTTTTTARESTPTTAATTTTTLAETTTTESTTTTVVAAVPPEPPRDSGIRLSRRGLQATYRPGLISGPRFDGLDLDAVETTAEFSITAEAVENAKLWIAAMALLVTAAIVAGRDWRRDGPRSGSKRSGLASSGPASN